MIDILTYFGVFVGGMILGLVFFGGLWWTIQKGMRSRMPALWFGLSLFVRIGITLGGFYLLTRGHLLNFAFCLPGFFVMKMLIVHFTRQEPKSTQQKGEKDDATQPG